MRGRDGKKGLSKCDAITPSLIGYRHTSSGDAERNIKLIEFDDGTTFHLFGCDRSTKDTKSWGDSTVYTYTSLAVFISGLEAEHEYPFSDPTKRHGEELDTFRLLGKKGLRLLGLTPKAIKRLEDSMKFE